MSKALVIFSGGQDSVTCLGIALDQGFEVEAIGFSYGQRHNVELEQAKHITEKFDIPFHIIETPSIAQATESDLTRQGNGFDKKGGTFSSWVPNRNAFFFTLAHGLAQKIGAEFLVTGISDADNSGYPDCSADFALKIQNALNEGSNSFIKIVTPLIDCDKAETFYKAKKYGILKTVLEDSHTCYEGDREHWHEWGYGCGECPACQLRKQGWKEYKERFK